MLFRKTRTLPFCYAAIRVLRVPRALAFSLSTAQWWRIPSGDAHQRQNLLGERIARSIS
jgi:hypothetical protein